MSWLEIVATFLTVACVGLANFRSTWQYPVGILGTIVFFFVVWGAGLYANAGLQVFFTFVQLYGWWYWLKGDRGAKPPITRFRFWFMGVAYSCILAVIGGLILNVYTAANMAVLDSIVFGLSVFAQFLLDRKKIENWIVWGLVNAASVYLYASAGLYVLAVLYVALLCNTVVAYLMWKKELES